MGNILRKLARAEQHGAIAGDGRHRRQGVHALRARDAGNELQGQQRYACRCQIGAFTESRQGLAEADQHLSTAKQRKIGAASFGIRAQAANLREDIGFPEDLFAAADARTTARYRFIGEACFDAGRLLDDDLEPGLPQGLTLTGGESNAAFLGEGLASNSKNSGQTSLRVEVIQFDGAWQVFVALASYAARFKSCGGQENSGEPALLQIVSDIDGHWYAAIPAHQQISANKWFKVAVQNLVYIANFHFGPMILGDPVRLQHV